MQLTKFKLGRWKMLNLTGEFPVIVYMEAQQNLSFALNSLFSISVML